MLMMWMSAALATDCTPPDVARAFAAAADAGDAEALDQLLHPSFQVVFTMAGSDAASVLSRSVYLQLVRDGTLGGQPRTFEIEGVRGEGALHTVSVTLQSSALSFASDWTIVAHEGRCRLVTDVTVATPMPSP